MLKSFLAVVATAGLFTLAAAVPRTATAHICGSWQDQRRQPQWSNSYQPFPWNAPRDPEGGGLAPRYPTAGSPAPQVDYSTAPAPHKPETPPTTTIAVLGDSTADWLAYGLEAVFSD